MAPAEDRDQAFLGALAGLPPFDLGAPQPGSTSTVHWHGGAGDSTVSAGGGGGEGKVLVSCEYDDRSEPAQLSSFASVAAFAGNLQRNLEASGFMDAGVSRSVSVTDGVKVHVELSEKQRRKRFGQLLEVSSRKAAEQLSAIAGLPVDREKILDRGPREGKWPRTDWEWVACFEWEVWRQVFDHERSYEKDILKLQLTWKEKLTVTIAKILEKVTR